jgi:chromatin remodeling complex protein RSC6
MVRKANPAFVAPKELTPELEAVVGKGPMPFPQVMTNIWAYIKKNELQNPSNKRNIIADEKLLAVFGGKKEVTMFEMTKLLYNNVKK